MKNQRKLDRIILDLEDLVDEASGDTEDIQKAIDILKYVAVYDA